MALVTDICFGGDRFADNYGACSARYSLFRIVQIVVVPVWHDIYCRILVYEVTILRSSISKTYGLLDLSL